MPMIEEILPGLATSGSGMLPLGEQQLLDLAAGNTPLSSSLYDLVGDQIDTTNLSKPHAYLVYTMFDAKMNLIEESSGVLQVEDPNERRTLDALDLHVPKGGYLHTYVTNSGTQKVNFDKFTVLRLQGKTREIFHYYPYGLEIHGIDATQRKYKYRYSGKELQTAEWGQDGHGIELYDFGSRYYQATTGRWHVPDPAEQFHNPYLAMGNNPVVYVDPDGEFAITSLLVGMAYGALIGAGTSAAIYSVTAGISGSWNWSDFGETAAIGAIGGALGGGLGYVGSQIGTFGQSLGYNVLSNVASNTGTTLALGGEITAGSVAGMAVGGAIGAGIGNFSGVKGSSIKNIGAELGFGVAKGAVKGYFGSGVGIAVDGLTGNPHANPGQSLWNGTKNGAIAGGTLSALNIMSMGPAYKPTREYENFGIEEPIYRKGTFITKGLFPNSGAAIGRNLVINQVKEPKPGYSYVDEETGWEMRPDKMTEAIEAHESYHYIQQRRMGFANFYSRLSGEYIKFGRQNCYCTPGTLEWNAELYQFRNVGSEIYK